MSELKTRPTSASVVEFLALQPDARRADCDAVLRMIDIVMSSPGEVTIMALAPLTNVALAISLEPAFARSVRRIIYMGGAALTWGNVTPVASANIYNDQGQSIGEVEDLIIQRDGAAPVAVVSVGGFLGIGSRLVAVPLSELRFAEADSRWMLAGATKESLQARPVVSYAARG